MGYTLAGVGAGALIGGAIALARRSDAERLRDEFMGSVTTGQDPATVVARTEDKLGDLARSYRRTRRLTLAAGIFAVGAGLSLTVISELHDASPSVGDRIAFGGLAFAGALAIVTSRFEYPIESMVRLWSHDPGIRRLPRWRVEPLAGGAAVNVAGSF
jgi:predicted acylesterase/phospholipase RssA